jgi:N-acetylglucosamine kinase-like BadF-type ATPase
MKYYVAADGGGTKLFATLYDENFNIISSAACGGTNQLFRPREDIKRDVEELADKLIPEGITEVEGFDYSIVGDPAPLIEALGRKVEIKNCAFRREGDVALLSSCYEYGILAQAGTGSDAFLIQPDAEFAIGGWGVYFGDEGSGYDIGAKTIKAAIYDHDGRGPKTAIKDILMADWELKVMCNLIDVKLAGTSDFRRLIASATRICGKAAETGDEVAIGIFKDAAEELSHQVKTAIKQNGGKWIGPIVTSGGAWKSSPYMRKFFSESIHRDYPEAEVISPVFEPLVGSVILRHKENIPLPELCDILKTKFKEYLLR